MLSPTVITQIQNEFKDLVNEVHLIVFTREIECQLCPENVQLIKEVAETSDKISVEVFNFTLDKDRAEQYGIDKIPATVVKGKGKDYGIRFYGVPGGYEFPSFMNAIKMIGTGDSGLSEDVKSQLATVTKPVHIQVLVTPSCPYCAAAVKTAHQFAFECENIRSDMIEVQEFPEIAMRYSVMAVPKIVINERTHFEGAQPPNVFISYILTAIESSAGKDESD